MESPPSGITPLIPASPPPSNSTVNLQSTPKRTLTALVVGVVLGGAFLLLFAVGVFIFFHKRRKRLLAQRRSLLPTTSKQGLCPENPYGKQAQQNQLNVPPPIDDVVYQLPKSDPPPEVSPNIQSTKRQHDVSPSASGDLGSDRSPGLSPSSLLGTFTYEELASATDHFSSSNLLGQGGFGYVYKGVLPDGKEIAVKQLKSGSFQGEREFQAEVDTISRVHHRHLLSLVGRCIFGKQLMLVYEFIPNKTLEYHLHGKIWPPMSWEKRLKIALGAAKGLAYLHEDCHPKIIHRDIKAANILKVLITYSIHLHFQVADFGLAKFCADTDTHVSTRMMGTYGYLAPEYASSGKLTEKSDVYSFGVVLLELITGRRPVDNARPFIDDSMVDWVRPLLIQALESGDFDELVDQRLEEFDLYEMTQMIACATACVRRAARRRPLMSQVLRALEGKLSAEDLLKEIAPVNKTFHRSLDFDSNVRVKKIALDKRTIHRSLDYDSNAQFLIDLEIFRELNLGSFENQHDDFITEQGVPPSTSSTKNQHDAQEIDIGNSRTGATDVFEIAID